MMDDLPGMWEPSDLEGGEADTADKYGADAMEGRSGRSSLEDVIAELGRRLTIVRSHVMGLPDHPWIPGGEFNDELCDALGIERKR